MIELGPEQVRIVDPSWSARLETNARSAIAHQWEQLERTGCIDNFRLLAGDLQGLREGWFFADSDAFKWLDAASRVYVTHPSTELRERIDAFASLISRAQSPDGYLYTYNQLHFPDQRWSNLQIEHELYCHGHLIEAGISHQGAMGSPDLLAVAEKAASLIVRRFAAAGPEDTPGHPEIELALMKLYRITASQQYLDMAERFLERRGRIRRFAWHIYRQNQAVARRSAAVAAQRARYAATHPEHVPVPRPPGNRARRPPLAHLRFLLSGLSGKYAQQHLPQRSQAAPVGHAVRFAYLETAAALLCRERGNATLLHTLERTWERMVESRMYVTGGIGSLPEIEGFGRDYELHPEFAYAETCAALGCLFWNWEMALLTGDARYADLFEWQLYNAAAVGMGHDGRFYLYNNPLASRGGITRRAWFDVPCCPSNLSRVWASLGRYLYSHDKENLWVHQYIGSEATAEVHGPLGITCTSGLPWEGRVVLRLDTAGPVPFTLHLRIPAWAEDYTLRLNGRPIAAPRRLAHPAATRPVASGYTPYVAFYLPLARTWSPGDTVELELGLSIVGRRPSPRVRSCRGRVALTRGPLVYCLESVDNPDLDLFRARLDLASIGVRWRADLPVPGRHTCACGARAGRTGLGGLIALEARTVDGRPVTAIPYYAWANRGESQMAVLVGAG